MRRATILAFFILQACCATNPATGRLQWMLISERQEIQMGRSAVPEVEHQFGGVYCDHALTTYVNEVGGKLVPVCHRPDLLYSFEILNTDIPNAFALPGGFVFITRGLLIRLRSEAQLAGVLGHEIAHVCARHGAAHVSNAIGLKMLQAGLLIWAIASDVDPEIILAAAVLSEVTVSLIMLGFSRADELEADTLGADYCYRAGYPPQALIEVLYLLDEIEQASGSGDVPSFLRTHPKSRDRIKELEAYLQEKYPGSVAPKKDEAFERRTEKFRRDYASAKQYDEAIKARRQGQPQHALKLLNSAIQSSPDQPMYKLEKARTLEDGKNYAEARDEYARIEPKNFDAWFGLGRTEYRLNNNPAAKNALQEAAKLLPQNPDIHNWLASVYEREGNRSEAQKERRLYDKLRAQKDK
jgi:predicted Zn-dependent protease